MHPLSPELIALPPLRHPLQLAAGQTVPLDFDLVRGLRLREVNVKESFTLQDAADDWYRANLLNASETGGEALVFEQMRIAPESGLHLTLLCAIFARQRMLQVMQKATELGAAAVQPVFTERSVGLAGLEHEKAHAWRGQILRAVKQCRRGSVPALHPVLPLGDALQAAEWTAADLRLVLDERLDERLKGTDPLEHGSRRVALAVGPEGGWSDAESELLYASGARSLSLGGRILRAETAVLVGLTVVQHRLGDLH